VSARKVCTSIDHCVGFERQCVALRSWWVCLCLNRLVPNIVVLFLICTFIGPWIGSGPLWNQVLKHNSDICKNTWWRNLLFIHNYFGFENMVSWTVLYWLLYDSVVLFLYITHLQWFFQEWLYQNSWFTCRWLIFKNTSVHSGKDWVLFVDNAWCRPVLLVAVLQSNVI
jgi:hypothetical protein